MWFQDRPPERRQLLYFEYHLWEIHQQREWNAIHAIFSFSKLFDKNNRKFLLYKSLRYNFTARVYYIIKSMYSNTSYQILINGNLSPKLPPSLCVKQGRCPSPILSNIFQNDQHDIFAECDPITLENILFNSLSWAYDLLLMSTSKSYNLLYLENQNEGINARSKAPRVLDATLHT